MDRPMPGREDSRNLALIGLSFLSVAALISPAREYPIIDDWIYFQSVRDLLNMNYHPHDWSQALSIGHLVWGALFASVFGNNFTVLTIANLGISLACLCSLYLLLRTLDIDPAPALLGVALLGLNPIYLYLSYSFMTDITFLLYTLMASLLYIRGLKSGKERWLWLGSAAGALSYLTRQFGVLVVLAALVWIWLAHRWHWRRALAIAGIPAATAVCYAIWEHFQPTPLVTHLTDAVRSQMLQDPTGYLVDRAQWTTWLLCTLDLMVMPVLRLPSRPLVAAPIAALTVLFSVRSLRLYGSMFPENGNVLNDTGLLMHNYAARPVWNEVIWSLLGLLGALAISLHLAYCLEQLAAWLRRKPWIHGEYPDDYALLLYMLGWSMGVVMFVATPFLFDRYGLALLPILTLPALRRQSASRVTMNKVARSAATGPPIQRMRWARLGPWVILAPLACFSLFALRDYKAHAERRWESAQELVTQGASPLNIRAGFEWENFYGFELAARRIRQTGNLANINYPASEVFDPIYAVSDLPLPGYSEIRSATYVSWLDGGAKLPVLTMTRK